MTAEIEYKKVFEEARRFLEREMDKAMQEFRGIIQDNENQLTEYKAYLVGRWSMGHDLKAILGEGDG